MSSVIPLTVARREGLGKGGARKARAAGLIPGVLYGHGEPPVAVSVPRREFDVALRHHRGGNPIVSLQVDGAEHTALIRAVQYDPINHDILHLDFQHVSLTEQIEVEVNVHVTGAAAGVKEGGILETILRTVRVRCLPTAIPGSIDVDVTALGIGESVHVRDLSAPEVEILSDPDLTVVTVVPPTVIAETPTAEAAEVAAAPAEPEVIAKGKKEEGEGESK